MQDFAKQMYEANKKRIKVFAFLLGMAILGALFLIVYAAALLAKVS